MARTTYHHDGRVYTDQREACLAWRAYNDDRRIPIGDEVLIDVRYANGTQTRLRPERVHPSMQVRPLRTSKWA